jgi:hypothetical protein
MYSFGDDIYIISTIIKTLLGKYTSLDKRLYSKFSTSFNFAKHILLHVVRIMQVRRDWVW